MLRYLSRTRLPVPAVRLPGRAFARYARSKAGLQNLTLLRVSSHEAFPLPAVQVEVPQLHNSSKAPLTTPRVAADQHTVLIAWPDGRESRL